LHWGSFKQQSSQSFSNTGSLFQIIASKQQTVHVSSSADCFPARQFVLSARQIALSARQFVLSARQIALSARQIALSARQIALLLGR